MVCRRCLALALLSLVLHLLLLSLRLEPRTDPAGMLPSNAGDASQLAAPSEQLLHDIRAFGRVPKHVRGSSDAQVRERNLAFRLRKARAAGRVSAAQESELSDLGDAPRCHRRPLLGPPLTGRLGAAVLLSLR